LQNDTGQAAVSINVGRSSFDNNSRMGTLRFSGF
jgi:hypothetical protein